MAKVTLTYVEDQDKIQITVAEIRFNFSEVVEQFKEKLSKIQKEMDSFLTNSS